MRGHALPVVRYWEEYARVRLQPGQTAIDVLARLVTELSVQERPEHNDQLDLRLLSQDDTRHGEKWHAMRLDHLRTRARGCQGIFDDDSVRRLGQLGPRASRREVAYDEAR